MRTTRRHRTGAAVLAAVLGAGLTMAACGDASSNTSDSGSGDETTTDAGSVDMVALSSLDIELPAEFEYDPPVPADATLDEMNERTAGDVTFGGHELWLSTEAAFDDVSDDYDRYAEEMDSWVATPDSMAWSLRATADGPALTVAFVGDRLNIAQVNDRE